MALLTYFGPLYGLKACTGVRFTLCKLIPTELVGKPILWVGGVAAHLWEWFQQAPDTCLFSSAYRFHERRVLRATISWYGVSNGHFSHAVLPWGARFALFAGSVTDVVPGRSTTSPLSSSNRLVFLPFCELSATEWAGLALGSNYTILLHGKSWIVQSSAISNSDIWWQLGRLSL